MPRRKRASKPTVKFKTVKTPRGYTPTGAHKAPRQPGKTKVVFVKKGH